MSKNFFSGFFNTTQEIILGKIETKEVEKKVFIY